MRISASLIVLCAVAWSFEAQGRSVVVQTEVRRIWCPSCERSWQERVEVSPPLKSGQILRLRDHPQLPHSCCPRCDLVVPLRGEPETDERKLDRLGRLRTTAHYEALLKRSEAVRLAVAHETIDSPPDVVAWAYLVAAAPTRMHPVPDAAACQQKAIHYLDRYLATPELSAEQKAISLLLKGFMLRLLGRFDEARASLEQIPHSESEQGNALRCVAEGEIELADEGWPKYTYHRFCGAQPRAKALPHPTTAFGLAVNPAPVWIEEGPRRYPIQMRVMAVEGTATAAIHVSSQGLPMNVRVLHSTQKQFERAILEFCRHSVFEPRLDEHGQPHPFAVIVEYRCAIDVERVSGSWSLFGDI